MMSGASTSAGTVDAVFLFIAGVGLFFLVLITFLLIFFIVKYNKKRHRVPKDIHGNTTLEVVWTVIPTILVLFMFYFGWKGFEYIRNAPEDALHVKVTARMWSWMFEYDNGLKTDTLYVPVNRPVQLELHSLDVIHSFFIPAFRIKEDAVPGMTNTLWFKASEPGDYDVLCAEYCGLRHAYMLSKVKAMPAEQFAVWYAEASRALPEKGTAAEESPEVKKAVEVQGKQILRIRGCVACHSTDGSVIIGPSLKGLYGKSRIVLVDGREKNVVADEDYLRRSVLEPEIELVKGFNNLMPSQKGQMSEEELSILIEYLKGLQ